MMMAVDRILFVIASIVFPTPSAPLRRGQKLKFCFTTFPSRIEVLACRLNGIECITGAAATLCVVPKEPALSRISAAKWVRHEYWVSLGWHFRIPAN